MLFLNFYYFWYLYWQVEGIFESESIVKANVMISISKNIIYTNFVYDNNTLEEITLYSYLEISVKKKL